MTTKSYIRDLCNITVDLSDRSPLAVSIEERIVALLGATPSHPWTSDGLDRIRQIVTEELDLAYPDRNVVDLELQIGEGEDGQVNVSFTVPPLREKP